VLRGRNQIGRWAESSGGFSPGNDETSYAQTSPLLKCLRLEDEKLWRFLPESRVSENSIASVSS
jgi:hypothetical protein